MKYFTQACEYSVFYDKWFLYCQCIDLSSDIALFIWWNFHNNIEIKNLRQHISWSGKKRDFINWYSSFQLTWNSYERNFLVKGNRQ